MKILITGSRGFIGRRLALAFAAEGHQLVCLVRRPQDAPPIAQAIRVPMDFREAGSEQDWLPLLAGVGLVVNTVGIFRESQAGDYDRMHVRTPLALFRAAARIGGIAIVHFSALGADQDAASALHLSKRQADDALRALGVPAAIVQPSLVYGPEGSSAALFDRLAVLPVLPLPQGGRQQIQPVHIDDVVDGVLALVRRPMCDTVTIAFCGPVPMSVRDYIGELRIALGIVAAQYVIALPRRAALLLAGVAGILPGGVVDRQAIAMLDRGNVAEPTAFAALLGRMPRAARSFVPPQLADGLRLRALLGLALPLLRGAVALVWIWTGCVSLGLYPVQDSLAMLARTGVPAALAPYALYCAALLDLALGILTLCWRGGRRRMLWAAQIVLISVYTVIISARLPEFWLHPFGPLAKNLPMLAAIGLLWLLEPDSRRGR